MINTIKLLPIAIENQFFGKNVTVSGLLTAKDILNVLKDKSLVDGIILPESVLNTDQLFLDDMTLKAFQKASKMKVLVSKISGKDLMEKIKEI